MNDKKYKSIKVLFAKKEVKFNKRKHINDPWINFGIQKSVKEKNIIFIFV